MSDHIHADKGKGCVFISFVWSSLWCSLLSHLLLLQCSVGTSYLSVRGLLPRALCSGLGGETAGGGQKQQELRVASGQLCSE